MKRRARTALYLTEAILTVLLVLFLAVLARDRVRTDVSLREIEEAVLPLSEGSARMKKAGAMKLRSLYGLSENDYEEVVLYVPASNMDAEELLLVRCRDEAGARAVEEAMEDRLAYQEKIFGSYGVEQMGILEQAEIETRGPYCVLIFDRNSAAMLDAFLSLTGS